MNEYKPLPVREKKPKIGNGKTCFKTATEAAKACKELREETWKHELNAKHSAEKAANDRKTVRLMMQAGAVGMALLTVANIALMIFLRE